MCLVALEWILVARDLLLACEPFFYASKKLTHLSDQYCDEMLVAGVWPMEGLDVVIDVTNALASP